MKQTKDIHPAIPYFDLNLQMSFEFIDQLEEIEQCHFEQFENR